MTKRFLSVVFILTLCGCSSEPAKDEASKDASTAKTCGCGIVDCDRRY